MNKGATTVKETRYELILDALKSGTFKAKDMAEATQVNRNQITQDLKTLQLMYPQIKHYGTTGSSSKWVWEEAEKKTVKEMKEENDRYSVNKNDEGYSDPTAAAVIKSMDNIYGSKVPGSVWSVSSANGKVEEYLILSDFRDCCSCLMLLTDKSQWNPVYCVAVDFTTDSYVDVRRICPKPSRYFLQYEFEIKNLEAVQNRINKIFRFPVQEKTVEVPVPVEIEKKVEVPVEVIKTVEVKVPVPVETERDTTVDAVDTALLRQKADIYERIAWTFLNGIHDNMKEGE